MFDRWVALASSNMGTKIISVIIAVVLWVVVLGSRNVEVTKEIPLEIITPTDLVPANDVPEKIAFRLSGPKAFLRAILDRREDPIRVNLSGSKAGLVTYRFFSDNIRVPIGVKVLSINPTAILIKLEDLKRRDVPVKVELRGLPPEGFRVVRTDVTPAVVRIKGAESRVDSLSLVSTLPIDVSDLKETMVREVPLDLLKAGIQLDGPLPKVTIEIEPSEANYRIRDVDVRVLTNHKFTLSAKTVTVMVRAAQGDIQSLNRNRVYAVLDLRGRAKGKYTERLKVTLPDGVTLAKVIPDQLSVTLY